MNWLVWMLAVVGAWSIVRWIWRNRHAGSSWNKFPPIGGSGLT